MRRIRKPWPPKNVSPDSHEACSMKEAESSLLAALPDAQDKAKLARVRFDALDKKKLRKVLSEEQRHICVYCEQAIKEQEPLPRIDHWRPLHDNPDLALAWENLYLSCPNNESCDVAKHETSLKAEATDPDLPWPTVTDYQDWIGFTRLGEMYVRADVNLPEATRRALEIAIGQPGEGNDILGTGILRLNHRKLMTARRAALNAERERLNEDFGDTHASRDERALRATRLLQKATFLSFISIRIAWLKSMLGRHMPAQPVSREQPLSSGTSQRRRPPP